MITAADIVTPLKRAKQSSKLSEGKGPITPFNANETFIERAKKQGTAKDKERAERIQRVLHTTKTAEKSAVFYFPTPQRRGRILSAPTRVN